MLDKKTILNVALGIVLAAAVIYVGWYIIDTRQVALRNADAINNIVNFLNQQNQQKSPVSPVPPVQ